VTSGAPQMEGSGATGTVENHPGAHGFWRFTVLVCPLLARLPPVLGAAYFPSENSQKSRDRRVVTGSSRRQTV